MTITKRAYLKQVLPRLYFEVEAQLKMIRPELISQIEHLYITGRCPCGDAGCVQFYCESSKPGVAPVGIRRPAYFDIPGMLAGAMIGIGRGDIVTGFEILSDYEDDYIQERLEANGFPKGSNDEGGSASAIDVSE